MRIVYTIGEISKIVSISANALRYYDEIGLLKPSLTKSDNQYRYYSDSQIKDITFIIELKQYGFTLCEIKELMGNKNNNKLKYMLEEKRTKLYKEMKRLKDSTLLLEKRIFEIIKEEDLKMNGVKVLVVDDLELARIMIKNIIEDYGYIVIGEASDGQEAIDCYEQLQPDIVIMNIVMPKMDGIDATRKITEKYKNARIIICSSINKDSIIEDSIKAGARNFVLKPLSSLSLINAIEKSFDDNYKFELGKMDNVSLDEEMVIGHSSILEEKTLMNLKNKFISYSKELVTHIFDYFKEECQIKILTVENITMGEFKTLMNDGNSRGLIKVEKLSEPISIYINGQFKNHKEITNGVLNSILNSFSTFLPGDKISNLILNLVNTKDFNMDYEIVLVSFSIEFAIGGKGIVAIGIPHAVLTSI